MQHVHVAIKHLQWNHTWWIWQRLYWYWSSN